MPDKPTLLRRLLSPLRLRDLRTVLLALLALYAVLGYAVVPWLVEREAEAWVDAEIPASLRLEDVDFDPFLLRLRLEGVDLRDAEGRSVLRAGRFEANLQLSSLVRRAWTLAELRLSALELDLVRDAEGRFNLARMFVPKEAEPEPQPETREPGPWPRILVHRAVLEAGRIELEDRTRAEAFRAALGPVDLTLLELTTLPGREGRLELAAQLEAGGQLGAEASFSLSPMHSSGRVELEEAGLALAWRYFREELGFELEEGRLSLLFDYEVDLEDDPVVRVDALRAELADLRARDAAGELLRVERLQASDAVLRWPESHVRLGSVELADAHLTLRREEDGALALPRLGSDAGPDAQPPEEPGAEGAEAPAPAAAQGEPTPDGEEPPSWTFELGGFRARDVRATLRDRSLTPPAELSLELVRFELGELTSDAESRAPWELELDVAEGEVRGDGHLALAPRSVEGTLRGEGLALAAAAPYLQQVARVDVAGGRLALEARLRSGPEESLALDGGLDLTDLALTGPEEGEPLLGWGRLAFEKVALRLDERRVGMERIGLEGLEASIRIDAQGRSNLSRLLVQTPAPEGGGEVPPADRDAPPAGAEAAWRIAVDRFQAEGAQVRLEDRSLPLPFEMRIEPIQLSVRGIDPADDQPSRIELDARIEGSGHLTAQGDLRLREPLAAARFEAHAEGLYLPPLSPYAAAFVGYGIEGGALDLRVESTLREGRLEARNRLVIESLALGKRIPSPQALDLPLPLAIALLTDGSGTIRLELPIEGQLGSPEFGMGPAIRGALRNVLGRVVASPFRVLGSLVGAGDVDLERFTFRPGSDRLSADDRATLDALARALEQRPELGLRIPAVYSPIADGRALARRRVREQLREALDGSDDPDRRREVLEELFLAAEERGTLAALRERHRGGEGTLQLEPYLDALEDALVEREKVPEEALRELALSRARVLEAGLTARDEALAPRIESAETAEPRPRDTEAPVELRLELRTTPEA